MKRIYLIKCILIAILSLSLAFFVQILNADISTSTMLNPPIDDSTIISKLQSNIDLDPVLSTEGITVFSNQGVVTLEGEVSSPEIIDLAIQASREMEGVIDVKSDLTIKN